MLTLGINATPQQQLYIDVSLDASPAKEIGHLLVHHMPPPSTSISSNRNCLQVTQLQDNVVLLRLAIIESGSHTQSLNFKPPQSRFAYQKFPSLSTRSQSSLDVSNSTGGQKMTMDQSSHL